jgi:hypothetical protein
VQSIFIPFLGAKLVFISFTFIIIFRIIRNPAIGNFCPFTLFIRLFEKGQIHQNLQKCIPCPCICGSTLMCNASLPQHQEQRVIIKYQRIYGNFKNVRLRVAYKPDTNYFHCSQSDSKTVELSGLSNVFIVRISRLSKLIRNLSCESRMAPVQFRFHWLYFNLPIQQGGINIIQSLLSFLFLFLATSPDRSDLFA